MSPSSSMPHFVVHEASKWANQQKLPQMVLCACDLSFAFSFAFVWNLIFIVNCKCNKSLMLSKKFYSARYRVHFFSEMFLFSGYGFSLTNDTLFLFISQSWKIPSQIFIYLFFVWISLADSFSFTKYMLPNTFIMIR